MYCIIIRGSQQADYQPKAPRPDLKFDTRIRLKAFILRYLSATAYYWSVVRWLTR